MITIEQVVTIVLSSGTFTGIISWMFKNWYQKKLNENLEDHKTELNKDLEDHKGEIKKGLDIQLESHKGAIKKEIDSYIETHKGDIQKSLEKFKDYNTKENLESSRFVEVICHQRILWLEKLRFDLTEVISNTRMLVGLNGRKGMFENMANFAVLNKLQNDTDTPKEATEKIFNDWLDTQRELLIHNTSILKSIVNLKLRLNIVDDIVLINLLDDLQLKIIKEPIESEIDDILKEITSKFQQILKIEWERVKQEVRNGKEVNEDVVDLSHEFNEIL